MSTTALKLGSLAIRTLAKPIASRIKSQARDHPRFRRVCISIAQGLHRVDIRLRLGLLQDSSKTIKEHEALDRKRRHVEAIQKLKEAEAVYPGLTARVRSDTPILREPPKDLGKESVKEDTKVHRIRPLSEAKAIDTGANFISEAFLFAVAGSLILFEQVRSRRKEAGRRDIVRERLELLEDRKRQDEQRLEQLESLSRKQHEHIVSLREQIWRLQGGKGEWPGWKPDMSFRTWKPTRLWEPEKKEDGGWFKSFWPQASQSGLDQEGSKEVGFKKSSASARDEVVSKNASSGDGKSL